MMGGPSRQVPGGRGRPYPRTTMSSAAARRRISPTGIAFMVIGLGLVLYEVRTSFMRDRLGIGGHVVIIICGTAFSVWGLKELVAQYFPRLAGRGDRFLLPREGWAFLLIMGVLFVGSILGRSNLLLLVFAVMAGPFVMNGWFTFTMLRQLRVRREAPPRAMAGESFTVNVVLENRKSWLTVWLMTVQDSILGHRLAMTPEVLFLRVPPSSSRQGSYRLRLPGRGRYELSHLSVTTRFPLGLVQRGVGIDAPEQILVYPRLGRLHADWRKLLQHSMELVSHARSTAGTFRDEMHRLREYRTGDDPRMIHWRTSARLNELMVREYHETRDRDLLIVMDAWTSARPSEAELERVERGLSFAASLCVDYLRYSRQSSLSVILLGKSRVDWSGDAGEHQIDALLDGFALLEPTSERLPHDMLQELESEVSRRRRTVLVTTRPDMIRNELAVLQNGLPVDLNVFGTSSSELSEYFSEE